MNYFSYLKKKGFKKCSAFYITRKEGYRMSEDEINESHCPKMMTVDDDGDLVDEFSYGGSHLMLLKHSESDLKLISDKRGIGDFAGSLDNRWNQLIQKNGDDIYYIYLFKSTFTLLVTDKDFSYMIKGVYSTSVLLNGNFDDILISLIGKVKYRDYVINKI